MKRTPLFCLLLLAGCGPLVQVGGNAPRPAALYTLSTDAPPAAARAAPLSLAAAVAVATPTVPGALQTLRIPVTVSDTAIQYLVAAQWSEQPNRLFQRLLAETLAAGGTPVVDNRSSGLVAERRLTGQLMGFGIDMRGGSPVARVRYDASFQTATGVRQRRFERAEPLAVADGPAAAAGLNRAANAVAAEVAAWVRSAG